MKRNPFVVFGTILAALTVAVIALAAGNESFTVVGTPGTTGMNACVLVRPVPYASAQLSIVYFTPPSSGGTNLIFFRLSNAATVTQYAGPGSNIVYCQDSAGGNTNVVGYAAGNVVVEWDPNSGTLQKNAVATSGEATNSLTLVSGLATNASINSVFYLATPIAMDNVYSANGVITTPIWNGQPGLPLLVDIPGAGALINAAGGTFIGPNSTQ